MLDWLSQPATVQKFGQISDAIWSYAELGLQEHKSSALLTETLEEAGFTVEKGLAGMPTCFVASYGSGKPVVGILAEYDALPMLSQKGRIAQAGPAGGRRAGPRLRPQPDGHGGRRRGDRRQAGDGEAQPRRHDQAVRLAGRGDR